MLEELLKFLEDKKILILGFGREGKASYNLIRRHFPKKKLYIADKDTKVKEVVLNLESKFGNKDLVELILGENYLDSLEEYEIILKTPGQSFKDVDTKNIKDKIYTSMDLFLRFYDILTIGITGSKGKSTTSTLIYKMLKDAGKDVLLLGNIGIPIFDRIEEIKSDSIAVLEISSHQLEFMKYTTKIAILINIYPAHLDHHNEYQEYIDAKYNIFENEKNMKELDPKFKQYQIYGAETDAMKNKKYKYNEEAICIHIDNRDYDEIISKLNLHIKGKHNIHNSMFALIVADILNLDIHDSIKSIENFKGLEHRLEYVEEIDGVEYYNDSIATIPDATIQAIETFKNMKTLILGGGDSGIDHKGLIKLINNIYDNENYSLENIILLPDTGHSLAKEIRDEYKKYIVKDVIEAAEKAVEITKEGVCVLSPAAVSYGYYKNFEERGNMFKDKIRELKNERRK